MSFCVEDGYNTSYIDSVLIALFYKPTHLHELLTQLPEKVMFSYLQELIFSNFVEQVRKNYSINSGLMNEIRNYSVVCGWKNGHPLSELYNVSEYLDFLLTGFNSFPIKIETLSSQSILTNYITLNVHEDSNIKSLLDEWINTTTSKQPYIFEDLPPLVPIYINRNVDGYKIDIKKRIQFHKNNNKSQNNASWIIQSIICYSRVGKGHYYTILYTTYGDWYLFDNNKLPSLLKIDIYDSDIAEKIKQECVLILYRIDDILCNL
jgi:hypothetical protein